MARRTADDTRRLLLDAGLQLLLERGASAGVQHIRLQEVLRNVGLTTGAAYRIWADQTEYHRDLAIAMVRLRFASPTANVAAAIADAASMDDVIRAATREHVSNAELFHLEPESRASHAFTTALALRTAAGAWPELREASAQRHAESVAAYAAMYAELMEGFGYRMRTPLTVDDFAEVLAALGEGFAVRAAEGLIHPTYEIAEGDELAPGQWSLFGLAVRALADSFFVPKDPSAAEAATGSGQEPS
ncbi:hypothetical protein ACFQRL_10270 [Microbacterium fluvii]|uniref:HTH tetR-type domain-containing protein n=1 Tax=Microbacterium fluvii TaxID=415215 RepID=A0ABW2HFJ8_9MICO|nr:hypothetical protein [Microbacterium fluvii]MCU4672978.1 hypothetical protein [Microbacterium fluvii]